MFQAPVDWFRSCEMEYLSIVMQEHCAHRVCSELGRKGIFQFTDLNPDLTPFQRRNIKEVQRCDEMERKLKYFDDMLSKYNIKSRPAPSIDIFLDELDRKLGGQSALVLLDQLENILLEREKELLTLSAYGSSLTVEFNSKVELKHVLEKVRVLANSTGVVGNEVPAADVVGAQAGAEIGIGEMAGMKFRFLAGVVSKQERQGFERMVFRTTRGNCYTRFAEIEEPLYDATTGKEVAKDVFIIFYQAQYIEAKLKKVCDAFGAKISEVPGLEDAQKIAQLMLQTNTELIEQERVLRKNRSDMTVLLRDIGLMIEQWKYTIRHEKSIYHNLNLCMADVSGVLRGEGWVVAKEKEKVMEVVREVHASMMGDTSRTLPSWTTVLPSSEWPSKAPTYFVTNKFTEVFQIIINTYGIPKYQEANPALFSAVAFPFMFGVMFGDIGHGLLLFLFGAGLLIKENELAKNPNLGELGELLYNGRYMLFLNGLFAFYSGLIYNDCFGMGLLLFTPTWHAGTPYNTTGGQTTTEFERIEVDGQYQIYPLGIDPTWHASGNSLLFFNSFKMKMAVIIGVLQMTLGIILRGTNAIHFGKGKGFNLDFWFEAVPYIIFLWSLFGYMCFMIIYKWCLPWGTDCGRDECIPPSLITTMINMALSPGSVEFPLYNKATQETVQSALMLIAVLAIPIMLVPKPYILIKKMNKEKKEREEAIVHHEDDAEDHGHAAHDAHGHEEHGSGDIIIHQAIETIEFVLGCVSNTASYLRLWALSLAHSQLSLVFIERTVLDALKVSGAVGPVQTWAFTAAFFGATFAVILCMDNLECFLHGLRLVWVEFMNKFYKGEGLQFAPINFYKSMKSPKE